MRTNKKGLIILLGVLFITLLSAPLLAAEGMKVRMKVDGMV